jgi:hypothetical protein
VIGVALGHGYPEAPLFGMAPCPTTIATFGLLLLVRSPLPRHLLTIPLVWAVVAPLAAVGHGYPEDLGLFVVGVAALVIIVARDRRTPRARSDRHPSIHASQAPTSGRDGAMTAALASGQPRPAPRRDGSPAAVLHIERTKDTP